MDHNWYRRKTWTEVDEREFFERLSRSRGNFNKAQYLRIQAYYLQDEYPAAALQLLELSVSEYHDHIQLAQCYLQMALCYAALFSPNHAIGFFRKALEQETLNQNFRTNASVDFAAFVIKSQMVELYDEADAVLASHEPLSPSFPLERYKYYAYRALIAEHRKDFQSATYFAVRALAAADLRHSGFRNHPNLGLVESQDPVIEAKLVELAARGNG